MMTRCLILVAVANFAAGSALPASAVCPGAPASPPVPGVPASPFAPGAPASPDAPGVPGVPASPAGPGGPAGPDEVLLQCADATAIARVAAEARTVDSRTLRLGIEAGLR